MFTQLASRRSNHSVERIPTCGKGCGLVALVLLFACSWSVAQSSKISPDLASLPAGSRVNVIIQYYSTPNANDLSVAKSAGAMNSRALSQTDIHGFTMSLRQAMQLVRADRNVKYISPDRPLHATTTSAPPAVLDYYDATVNASYAWGRGLDGTGIGVAIIDSGIIDVADLHSGLASRVVYSQNFTGGKSAVDTYGHGSHVAGIVGGNGKNSTGSNYFYTFKGIAPNVNLINLRVLDQNGQGSDSNVIAAINKAISLKSKYNIRVINLSLGRPVYESSSLDPLCLAVENAWKAGIVVVTAAGNDGRDDTAQTSGYGTITAPGNDPYVITVGAMKTMGTPSASDDQIASYSSKGPTLVDHVVKPDLVAPGNRVISLYNTSLTLNKQYPGNEIPNSLYQVNGNNSPSPYYYQLSGTSMAAPMVSGTAALMLQQNRNLTPDQVKARLMKTASKVFPQYSTATDPLTGITYTSQYDIFTVGAGYLDVQAALSNTDLAPAKVGSALSPAVAVDSNGNVYIVTGSSTIWDNSVMWGTSVVWGTSVIWGTNVSGESVLWGSSVVWGTSDDQGYSVLWGTSVMWGATTASATESNAVTIYGEN